MFGQTLDLLRIRIWPYLRRALRVFLYGAIPAVAAWLVDSNLYNLEIALRLAASAALLALVDKARMNRAAGS